MVRCEQLVGQCQRLPVVLLYASEIAACCRDIGFVLEHVDDIRMIGWQGLAAKEPDVRVYDRIIG